MSAVTKEVTVVEVVQPDGSVNVVEKTVTMAKVKKTIVARQNLKPFGSVAGEDFSRAVEKPIEIRCLPPAAAQQLAEDSLATSNEPAFILDQLPTAPRCKHCGMEGHLSLKCPKRKEIEVKTKVEVQEVTVLLADISDMTTRPELFALVDDAARTVNDKLYHASTDYQPISLNAIKTTLPLTQDGQRHRGIAFINIQYSPSAEAFANGLVDHLDGAKLGMVLIRAQINVAKQRRAPNRFDDEEKWGGAVNRR